MTQTTESLSLGQQLKAGREALGLSTEEVAQKTNLKKNHIDSLENDIFILHNVPPTFVRGYVRNYVRFLRLPESLIDSVTYGEVKIPKEVKKIAPIPVKNHKSQTRWVKTLTWLVLLGAVGMTLAWWWQEHKKEQASRDELLVTKTTETVTNVTNEITLTPPALTPVSTTETPAVAPPIQEVNSVNISTTPLQSATPVGAEQAQQPVTDTQQTEETVSLVNVPQTAVQEEQVNVLQQSGTTETETITAEAAETIEATTEQAPQAIGNDELRIEITNGQSWITVRDAKNKRLAEKLYNSGEVLTFNDNEQYRLTVGAPANVKIYYKGQEVPLKVDGRVARFKLPLAN
ncbi:RodZ domain-containing protein [Glaesserella sp.]|uniref:RodZ domain-containing protein n=1 Tax=Glaesserella sp. TaxID=2094731 RepID=UPI0035A00EFC